MESEPLSSPGNAKGESAETAAVELRNLLRKASDLVGTLISGGTKGNERLASLQSKVNAAAQSPQVITAQAAEVLASLHAEVTNFRLDLNNYIGAFRTGKLGAFDGRSTSDDPAHIDSTTGLCNREGAEYRLRLRLGQDHQVCVAVFIVERLPLINGRFGRAAGDKVLLNVSQHLAQTLPSISFLSRWSGPAFLATFEMDSAGSDLERDIQRTAGVRIHQELRTGDRSILMPISCFAYFHRVVENESAEILFQRVDTLIAAKVMPVA